MHKPKGVLFDHDGVLVDSERLHLAAWKEVFREMGFTPNENEFSDLVGRTAPQILSLLYSRHKPESPLTEAEAETWALRKNHFYGASIANELQAYPGVLPLLSRLKADGVKMGVVSNSRNRELNSALEHVGLHTYFDVILSREEVPAPKPSPEAYLFGAKSLGLTPSELWVIEDSPTGLQSALLGGIPAIGIASNFSSAVLHSPVPGRPELTTLAVLENMEALLAYYSGFTPQTA
jgi:HAD superfamily hydrolase (TIGR01509 family)